MDLFPLLLNVCCYVRSPVFIAFFVFYVRFFLAGVVKCATLNHQTPRWIASFLSDRHTHILVDGFKSEAYAINAGITQGVKNVILQVYF